MSDSAEKSRKQINFEKKREHYSDRQIQMEILYSNWLIQAATEKTRANTSTIVWIIVIGVLLSIISAILVTPKFL
ncbi:hypothetical protein LCGC14_0710580 [marine sediment metagenome]|uniref:Uncharacterized protein n=2 Tax=root TaxID=1 RepID=A0A831VQA0_9FLAO|nr:hypothetical protein [Pricia antarctica]